LLSRETREVQVNSYVTVNGKQKAFLGMRYDFHDGLVKTFTKFVLKGNSTQVNINTSLERNKKYNTKNTDFYFKATHFMNSLLQMKGVISKDTVKEPTTGLLNFIVGAERNTTFFIHEDQLMPNDWTTWEWKDLRQVTMSEWSSKYFEELGLDGSLDQMADPKKYCENAGLCFEATHTAKFRL